MNATLSAKLRPGGMTPAERDAYQLRVLAQGDQWLNGFPVHNKVDDECTADFSCCNPSLFTKDRATRLRDVNRYRALCGLPARV